jgi:hypothetical protein
MSSNSFEAHQKCIQVKDHLVKPVRQRRSRKQILELLDLFKHSGQSVSLFYQQHMINRSVFHKWKSRYRTEAKAASSPGGFAQLQIMPSSSGSLFAEANGIRIFHTVSAAFLKELLP